MKEKIVLIGLAAIIGIGLISCQNEDKTFPDFDYQTVYFANQYPARTIELGEDLYVDNTLDNLHKLNIKAALGGTQNNTKDRIIDFVVDTTLCDGLYFKDTNLKVRPMPSSYYTLASDQIRIPAGSEDGGVEVSLTDAFFADPKALSNNYVIPLRMTHVEGADSILSGSPIVPNPIRTLDDNWSVKPKDFVLYCVKYINSIQGNYLRRGFDAVIKDGASSSVSRHTLYVENNEVLKMTTLSLSDVIYPIKYTSKFGVSLPISTNLSFDAANACVLSIPNSVIQVNDSVRIYDVVGQGVGKFVKRGERNSIGGSDRDAIYLDYTIAFKVQSSFPKAKPVIPTVLELIQYATKDTLVLRDRGVAPEYYTVIKK